MGEATSVAGYVQLSVDYGGIMRIARERFYEDHNITSAMNILMDITNCDELTKEEQESLCMDILMCKKDIVGVYPREQIRIIDCTEKPYDFFVEIDKLSQKAETAKKEYNSILQKFLFLCEKTDENRLRILNNSYYYETGEYLFCKDYGVDLETSSDVDELEEELDEDDELLECETYTSSDKEVESYIKRMMDDKRHSTEDYGWLSPNGEFFEADWGHHNEWAREYLEKNDPNYDDVRSDMCTDRLIELHWVLLDNPCGGIATPKYGEFGMTKAQKEFLYDYYLERNLKDEANSIWDK